MNLISNLKLKFFISLIVVFFFGVNQAFSQIAMPNLSIGFNGANTPQEFTNGVQRFVIVLSLVRNALGTSSLPPSQIIVGLSLILTFFVMAPTYNKINQEAIQPYLKNQITQEIALERSMVPIREYMVKYTKEKEIALFIKMAKMEKPKNWQTVPTYIILPAFILSELKAAFIIGFVLFLPFLVIDIVVASVLVSMGMVFLPPTVVAMPFKLILFVMIDGWYLITKSLLEGVMH